MNNIDKLSLIRSNERINFDVFLSSMFDNYYELHGDRCFADDQAIFTGMAFIGNQRFCVVGQRKGHDLDSNIKYNFGMPRPEGYRKVKRVVQIAEKFDIPVIMFIDTPGAYPGIDSEERGQGQAIAEMLYILADLKTPVISVLISEGGSGGALAIGVSDYIYGLENCYYSVISPEGYCEILFKGQKQVQDIIDEMPIFIDDLLKLEIIDQKINEPKQGALLDNSDLMIEELKKQVLIQINDLQKEDINVLITNRYQRYRKFGDVCLEK